MVDDACSYYKNLTLGGGSILENEKSFHVYYLTMLALITVVNIVGNSMVIIAFVRYKKLRYGAFNCQNFSCFTDQCDIFF